MTKKLILVLAFTVLAAASAYADQAWPSRDMATEYAQNLYATSSQFTTQLQVAGANLYLQQQAQQYTSYSNRFYQTVQSGADYNTAYPQFINLKNAFSTFRLTIHAQGTAIPAYLLDQWYQVAFNEIGLEKAMTQAPAPNPTSLEVRGAIAGSPVSFTGANVDQLYADCANYARGAGLGSVNSITIGTQAMRSSGWWSPDAVCAIFALNASASGGGILDSYVRVTIDGATFGLPNDGTDPVQLLSSYVPKVVTGSINAIGLNGTTFRSSGWWSPQAVVTIIYYSFAHNSGSLHASGTISDTPFLFTGTSPNDVEAQCLDFYGKTGLGMINQMVVNGQPQHNAGWWNASQACMIVKTLAHS